MTESMIGALTNATAGAVIQAVLDRLHGAGRNCDRCSGRFYDEDSNRK